MISDIFFNQKIGVVMNLYMKTILFGVVTLFLIIVSYKPLQSSRFHGFYRFFAWEFIAILVILNLNIWFRQPLSWHQLISWVLLLLSLYLVIEGIRLLRLIGKPNDQRIDDGLIGVEKTTQLVNVGLYSKIRHPLYSSLICLAWGAFFKSINWMGLLLAFGACLFLTLTAKIEEKENCDYFGEIYQDYRKHTKMFIPYLF